MYANSTSDVAEISEAHIGSRQFASTARYLGHFIAQAIPLHKHTPKPRISMTISLQLNLVSLPWKSPYSDAY